MTKNALKNLKVATAFIKEVLRISNIVELLFPRAVLKDIELPNGTIMPAGCQYMIDLAGLTQNQVWGSNPMKFDPNRFLQNNKMHPYQNIPFSAGKRNCIGRNFAMQGLG